MLVKAQGKFLRITPTKTRQVIDLIRGKDVNEAMHILSFVDKRPKVFVEKITSAEELILVSSFNLRSKYVDR